MTDRRKLLKQMFTEKELTILSVALERLANYHGKFQLVTDNKIYEKQHKKAEYEVMELKISLGL
jgi:predicted DNA-binding transcriptional regulator YafY